MFRFNRLGVILGTGAVAFAVIGLAIAAVAGPQESGVDTSGLMMSLLGL